MKTKNFFLEIARGTSMGLGAIPGVSAGTMAIVVGIYDRMISAISNLRKDFKNSFFTLLPLFIGAAISAAVLFVAVKFSYQYAPFAIACVFAAFTLGSMPIITKEVKGKPFKSSWIILCVVSFLVAAGVGAFSVVARVLWNFSLQTAFDNREIWVYFAVFAAGFVAAMACIIPGISGAMILYIAGLYNPVINLFMGEHAMWKGNGLVTGILLTVLLLLGVLFGVLVTGKGMEKLLEKHRQATFYVVIGFVLGSVVSMFINQEIWPYYYGAGLAEGSSSMIIQGWQYGVGAVALVALTILTLYVIKKHLRKIENTNAA